MNEAHPHVSLFNAFILNLCTLTLIFQIVYINILVLTMFFNFLDGIFSLSKTLLLFNYNEICKELQFSYETLIDLIQININEIWKDIVSEEENSKKATFKEFVYKPDLTKLGNYSFIF